MLTAIRHSAAVTRTVCSHPLVAKTALRALATSAAATSHKLPEKIIDSHHYYFDPAKNSFNKFLGSARSPAYLPEDYRADVIDKLAEKGCTVESSVHVEMTDDGPAEVSWLQSMMDAGRCDDIKAIVAYCDLSAPDAEEKLVQAKDKSDKVKAVRVILDHGGGETALGTHLAFKPMRIPNKDHLKIDMYGDVSPVFEKGIDLLSKYNLSFDALVAPAQLQRLAKLFKWHGDVNFVVEHLGKPATFLNNSAAPSKSGLSLWRQGMQSIADLPNAYVKLSMLGFAVPNWYTNPTREQLLQDLVLETVDRFGPERCMIGTNFHINNANADSDGLEKDNEAPAVPTVIERMSSWFEDFTESEQNDIFYGTAKRFYGI